MLGIDWIPGSEFEIAPEAQQSPRTPCSSFWLLSTSPQNVGLDFHWAVLVSHAMQVGPCTVCFGLLCLALIIVCVWVHVVAFTFKVITYFMVRTYFIQRVIDGHFGSLQLTVGGTSFC